MEVETELTSLRLQGSDSSYLKPELAHSLHGD